MSKRGRRIVTSYGPNCTKCGKQVPWPRMWNARTKSYFKTCPSCRADRRKTMSPRQPRLVEGRLDDSIRLSPEEQRRLALTGTLRCPTTLTTHRTWEPTQDR